MSGDRDIPDNNFLHSFPPKVTGLPSLLYETQSHMPPIMEENTQNGFSDCVKDWLEKLTAQKIPAFSAADFQQQVPDFPLMVPFDPIPQSTKNTEHTRRMSADHIKRPRNAFILFRTHAVTSNLIPKEVERDHRNISRIISHIWRNLSAEERKVWELQADIEKERHKLKHPNYKYRPASRRVKTNRRNVRRRSSTERQCEHIADAILKSYGHSGVKELRRISQSCVTTSSSALQGSTSLNLEMKTWPISFFESNSKTPCDSFGETVSPLKSDFILSDEKLFATTEQASTSPFNPDQSCTTSGFETGKLPFMPSMCDYFSPGSCSLEDASELPDLPTLSNSSRMKTSRRSSSAPPPGARMSQSVSTPQPDATLDWLFESQLLSSPQAVPNDLTAPSSPFVSTPVSMEPIDTVHLSSPPTSASPHVEYRTELPNQELNMRRFSLDTGFTFEQVLGWTDQQSAAPDLLSPISPKTLPSIEPKLLVNWHVSDPQQPHISETPTSTFQHFLSPNAPFQASSIQTHANVFDWPMSNHIPSSSDTVNESCS